MMCFYLMAATDYWGLPEKHVILYVKVQLPGNINMVSVQF